MIFEELKKCDHWRCFETDFITVAEAKANGLIPPSFAESFKDTCECGSDMIISKNRKHLMCCDPKCYIKMGYSLEAFIKSYGYKGIGSETCISIARHACKNKLLKHNSFLELIASQPEIKSPALMGAMGVHFKKFIDVLVSSKITFPDLMSRIQIPNICDSAHKIFQGMNCAKDLYDEVVRYGSVQGFLYSRGISDYYTYFYMSYFSSDIYLAERYFGSTIRRQGLQIVNMCATGSITALPGCKTKSQLVGMLNSLCTLEDGRQVFEFQLNRAMSTADHVVADSTSPTAQYRNAKKREEEMNYGRSKGLAPLKLIYTSKELYDYYSQIMQDIKTEVNKPNG